MKPFAACVFVALLSGVLSDPGAVEKWESFKARHGKNHAAHEEPLRMKAFLERDAALRAHNERYEAGLESFSLQHNQYSDLSTEEFARSALGFVPACNASDIPMAENSAMPALPAEFDWLKQGIMTSVKNQEYCGSCYAFAGSGALEAWLKWKTGATYDLSEQDVVDCSYRKFMNNNHNGGCEGGWPSAVYDYYNQKGLVHENSYPYTSGRSQRHGACRVPQAQNDNVRGRIRTVNVRTRDEDQMAELLVSKGPLVVAMAADNEYQKFFNNLGDGVFDSNQAIGLAPNHAVVLTGFGVQNGKKYWNIKNSWGATWANKGYGKIARGKNMCGINMYGVWYVE